MRYVTNAHCPKEALYNSIRLLTKELLTYHCGCHGNLVTLAMQYALGAYHSKEAPCQI